MPMTTAALCPWTPVTCRYKLRTVNPHQLWLKIRLCQVQENRSLQGLFSEQCPREQRREAPAGCSSCSAARLQQDCLQVAGGGRAGTFGTWCPQAGKPQASQAGEAVPGDKGRTLSVPTQGPESKKVQLETVCPAKLCHRREGGITCFPR